jgi:hypothetical protein
VLKYWRKSQKNSVQLSDEKKNSKTRQEKGDGKKEKNEYMVHLFIY